MDNINNISLKSDNIADEKSRILLLLPIHKLYNNKFLIDNYQRGYKWSKKEILELLNDIDTYDQSKGLYCLQPLILKPIDGGIKKVEIDGHCYSLFRNNEVVDGQQRLTTIYLILKYFHYRGWISDEHLYEIEFQTRERSGYFLANQLELIHNFPLDKITRRELEDKQYHDLKSVNELWESFIETHAHYYIDNVDVYHFFTVTCYLARWIDINLEMLSEREEFIAKLLRNVKVIWYSIDNNHNKDDVIRVFLNNNKGKIGLTSSELIKAIFILDIKRNEPAAIGTLKINQFAMEWDMVEKQLQDDSFWYFIQPNEEEYMEGTRIDYLFDLLLNKTKQSDSYFAYRHYELKYNVEEDIIGSWDDVVQLYYKLLNWYNDQKLYHYVGFLTNSKIKTLQELLSSSEKLSMDKLKESFIEIIKDKLSQKKVDEEGKAYYVYSVDRLDYKNSYREALRVLLLYNVSYYLENMANHKFPFELFVKEKWSIEHIIPQNPKDFDDVGVFYQWFKDVSTYGDLSVSPIIEKIKKYKSIDGLLKDKELRTELDKIIIECEDVTHSLNNLLLLDKNTNSSLGNNLFESKRYKILEFNRKGCNDKGKPTFIPMETLNAFNKTFGKNINIKNWTKEDGDNYVDSIKNRLKEFLPED